jgi:hypothetical protein
MAEVLLLCMRDDEEAAAILADLFYRAGFQTAGGAARPDGRLWAAGKAVSGIGKF